MNIRTELANGEQCEWLGVKTTDMTREELIAFVGMLDAYVTRLTQKEPQVNG